jgi:hypothetical protein
MILTPKRYENHLNRIEDPDMNPHSYTHLIFDKDNKNIQWSNDSLFNKCCGENLISSCKKLKVNPFVSSCTRIKSK